MLLTPSERGGSQVYCTYPPSSLYPLQTSQSNSLALRLTSVSRKVGRENTRTPNQVFGRLCPKGHAASQDRWDSSAPDLLCRRSLGLPLGRPTKLQPRRHCCAHPFYLYLQLCGIHRQRHCRHLPYVAHLSPLTATGSAETTCTPTASHLSHHHLCCGAYSHWLRW